MRKKILIDTDPGRDDAVALLLALASPELDIAGVVAVAGNVPIQHTARNTRRIVELAARSDVPIYAGCDRPMARKLVTAEQIHGPTGMDDDGYEPPEPKKGLESGHGVDFIIETLKSAEPRSVTLACIAPLTNVATALERAPDIASRIEEIVLMGGAHSELGNVSPTAEFNVHVDPEAADIVFNSGLSVTLVPLDLTHRVLSTRERLARIAALGNDAGRTIFELLDYWTVHMDLERFGGVGAPLHDPCVIAYLLKPELFAGRPVNVAVEKTSDLTLGMTVVDWWHATEREPNVRFLREVDADGFYALLTERIARLP